MSGEAPVLRVQRLGKSFRDVAAVSSVDLAVRKHEVVSIIGKSGCGKTTLLRCMAGLEWPDVGLIELQGRPFGLEYRDGVARRQSSRQMDTMRPKVGLVFQQLHLWPHLSALENVVRPQIVVLKRPRVEAADRARALFASLGLSAKADAFPHALSGGQKQRVAIARALAMDPALLMFDEPTSALDPELVSEVLTLLRGLASRGMTMVIVTHEMRFALNVSDRVILMNKGRIVEEMPAAQVSGLPKESEIARYMGLSNER